ncbi:heat shock 70 kDa protein 4-like [Cryptomeria japonica]|uniref:heat shock 70 kDa protein 4-like n=1 Tax=Cryptomeria japonica TaxID=3369 RepID=UPI0027DA2A55|nr:heat shock 70 kDa protein 4-like [Cryptomeria japonica]
MSNDKIDDIVLVGGSSRITKLQELLRQNFGQEELCNKVNPDKAIDYGAVMQAATLNNEDVSLTLMDVIPLSLGIETGSGVITVVVPRATPIPCQRGILSARCGVPRVKVCFQISKNGVLTASVEDEGSEASKEITITNVCGRLSKEERDKMIVDANEFQEDDEKVKTKNLARDTLEHYIYNMKSRVSEAKTKHNIKASSAEDFLSTLHSAQEWLDDNEHAEASEFENKLKELQFDRLPHFARNL